MGILTPLMKKILSIILALFILSGIGYFYVLLLLPFSLPALPSSTVFLDKNGHELGEVIYSGSIRHQDASSDDIPPFYKQSLVTLEDQTFWTNNGISIR